MLVNEIFKIVTVLKNNFHIKLSNIGLKIQIGYQHRHKVFLATKPGHPIQNLGSVIELAVPDLYPNSSTHVVYYVTSFVEGNIELSQKVWYETEQWSMKEGSSNAGDLDSPIITLNTDLSPLHYGGLSASAKGPDRLKKQISNHNIKIDFVDAVSLKKTKTDTIILPCVDEIRFTARLYTLSRQALLRAYKNEDFLMRVNMEVVAPFDIEILDRIFVTVIVL